MQTHTLYTYKVLKLILFLNIKNVNIVFKPSPIKLG